MTSQCHCCERHGKQKAPPNRWKIAMISTAAGRAIYSLLKFVKDLG